MEFFKICFMSLTLIQHSIWCGVYEECEGISEADVVVASKKSCAKYVFCDGEKSYEAECLKGYHFNEKVGSCDDPINVKCDIEPSDSVQSIFDVDFSPANSDNNTETNTNWDKNEIDKIHSNGNGASFSNNKSITPDPNPTCTPQSGFNNIRNIANSESCKAFYICYNGHAIPMLCPSNMYFNENIGKCEPEVPDSCQAKHSLRLNCSKGVYDFVPHPTRCEYYYYCVNGYLMIMRCPNKYTWHYERATCVHKSQSKCFTEQHSFYRKNN